MSEATTNLQTARRTLKRVRVLLWIGALIATIYLMMRFEVIALPEPSCSPLLDVPPGSSMWIDLYPRAPELGDILLFEDPHTDQLLLGRVARGPESLPAEALSELERGGVWIESDNPECPARDSRLLGIIAADRLRGRILYVW